MTAGLIAQLNQAIQSLSRKLLSRMFYKTWIQLWREKGIRNIIQTETKMISLLICFCQEPWAGAENKKIIEAPDKHNLDCVCLHMPHIHTHVYMHICMMGLFVFIIPWNLSKPLSKEGNTVCQRPEWVNYVLFYINLKFMHDWFFSSPNWKSAIYTIYN